MELPKVMLARTLVWLLAALVLAEYALTRRSLRRKVQTNPMSGPVGLLALVIVVTTATAIDWRLSLWGATPNLCRLRSELARHRQRRQGIQLGQLSRQWDNWAKYCQSAHLRQRQFHRKQWVLAC